MGLTGASATARASVLAMVVACGMGLSLTAMGQVDPQMTTKASPARSDANIKSEPNADFGPGLPFFDARLDGDGQVLARVTDVLAGSRSDQQLKARAADLARLRGIVDGVMVDDDAMMGTARFVRSTWRFLTPAKQQAEKWTPTSVTKEFIGTYPGLMEAGASEIDRARVERDFVTDHNQVRHLTFQQQIRGADLFEAEVRANVMPTGELINIQDTMLPRPEGDFVTPPIAFDAPSAIRIAAANVGVSIAGQPVATTDAEPGTLRQQWASIPELRDDEKVVTTLVYFALDRKTIHPAWHVIVPVKGAGHTYDVHVDATDGSVLRRHDWLVWETTQPVTMRVFPSDGIAPGTPGNPTNTAFQFPVLTSQSLTFSPADVSAFSPNGWINDGNMETTGNNVDAYLDADATANSPDLPRPNGGALRVFNLTFDPTLAPNANQTQKDATVVELFYRSNWYHDKLMALGFNEAARNFQLTNFSGLGVAGDYVRAEAQDGSGTNNANFGTSGSDGSTARCQMYIFTGPTPDRDGSYEGDIVYHELTHGTSIRLHGGLSGTQPGGMGEGWSDFVALCLLAEPTDNPDATYPMGGYTTYQLGSATYTTNYYFGIRRFPYSTDLGKAPQTYADIDTTQINFLATIPRSTVIGNTANEVHNIGEVWCEMLNEGRAALWHTYGFAGNQRMLQIVIDGMKLSVANPTLIQARDAILAANLADNSGADTDALWQAFAKRGLGYSATSPVSSTTTGVVEAYDGPNFATFTYPDGLPTQLSPSAAATFRVNIVGTALTITPGTQQMFVSIAGGAYAPVALTPAGTNMYTATIPAQTCFASVNYYFSTGTSLGNRTNPSNAPTGRYAAVTYTGSTTVASDGFETDQGWTVGTGAGDTATTGLWIRATPVSTTAQAGAAHGGTLCWVTGNAAAGAAVGTNDVDGGFTTLLSPVFNLSGSSDATVSYWRWYYNSGSTNTGRIDVSVNNGTTWVRAETLGPGNTAETVGGWRQASWTFSSLGLTPSAQVKLRFVAEDLTATIVEAALDDFRIDTFSCVSATSGACCVPAGTCSVAAGSGACAGTYQGDGTSCTPNPCVAATYTVSVLRTGTGFGTVTSTPGTIICPSTCDGVFAHGTAVSFTATPNSGSRFVGWSGACSGSGACAQTVTGPLSISAEFRCNADFNTSGALTVQDIFDFLAAWFAGTPSADFNNSGGLTVQDIFDFLSAWFAGCA